MSDEKKSEIKLSDDAQKIMDMVKKLSVLELADLVKALEEEFGVSAAAAPIAVAAAPGAGGEAGGEAEEKSEFDVELTGVGDNKIGVIKALKEILGVGLKDAKDLVDAAPKVVKEKAPKAEAEEMKKKIEEAGGQATLK